MAAEPKERPSPGGYTNIFTTRLNNAPRGRGLLGLNNVPRGRELLRLNNALRGRDTGTFLGRGR